MKIIPIGARQTNLMYLIIGKNNEMIFIDPVNSEKAQRVAYETLPSPSQIVTLITHHHPDHSGGSEEMLNFFPAMEIYAGSDKSFHTKLCKDGEILEIGSLEIKCLHTPCHTLDSFTYFICDKVDALHPAAFVGDTMFYLGCGKFFEGTPEMMYHSLQRIAGLPSGTQVYYGHNYKERNLDFRRKIAMCNPVDIVSEGLFLTVGEEKQNNLYINTSLLDSSKPFVPLSPVSRIKLLRKIKDSYDLQNPF